MAKRNKEVSIEEMLEQRSLSSNDDGVLFKAHTSPASYDEESRSATFVMSAETVDSYGDIVMQDGMDTTRFDSNPIAFFNHKAFDTPIGSWSDMKMVRSSPKRTEGRMTFVEEGVDDLADRVARHVAAGTLRGASIGFRPKKLERIFDEDGNWTYGYKFNEIELVECSVVTVPAVAQALVKGDIAGKDLVSPEVIEEFLDHLKSHPEIAQKLNAAKYEEAFLAATGNKLTHTVSVDIDGLEERLRKMVDDATARIDKAAGASTEDRADPIEEELKGAVEQAVSVAETKIADLKDGDDDRRTGLQKLLDGVKSVFGSKPAPATEEQKSAALERLKALRAAE